MRGFLIADFVLGAQASPPANRNSLSLVSQEGRRLN